MSPFTPPATGPGVQIARGKAAEQLLNDPAFQKDWMDLATGCGWATGCQTWEFADAWYNAYEGLYQALLLFQRDSKGRLIGLLPLAIEMTSNALVYVGAHQAQYQVWIAFDKFSDDFIEQALDLLRAHYPRQQLRLKYLPAGVPMGWRGPRRCWRRYSMLQMRSRPFLALGGDSSINKSLKKSGNRSKINRLKRIGALSFSYISTRAEFEGIIDTVADFYDLRQGAISPSTPFRDDPRKESLRSGCWTRAA